MTTLFDRLLSSLDLKVEAFGYCEVFPGWGLSFPAAPDPYVHYCLSGEGQLIINGREPIAIAPETCVIVPPGVGGTFRGPGEVRRYADAALAKLPEPPALLRVRAGETGESPLIIACGRMMLDRAGQRLLLESLSDVIASPGVAPFARGVVDQLIAELTVPRPGSRPIVDALLKVCVLLLLRMQFEKGRYPAWAISSAETGALERAIIKMIEMPEGDHSVERLADLSAMSRSRFLRVFSETMGETPGEFLRDLRLARAARLLAATQRSVTRIASEVGYDSRSHFSRLFKERYGRDPSAYRRDA